MSKRKSVSKYNEVQVFQRCRRRCCICFGLNKDETVKKGQIAHLDRNPSNDSIENLVFLCLEHHDIYDSRTSQSKNFTQGEIKAYRDELENHFSTWDIKTASLLRFLADYFDLEMMADAATKIASRYVWYGGQLAIEALTRNEIQYSDSELYIPFLATLDNFQSWGWLTYDYEEVSNEEGDEFINIKVSHKPVCAEVASIISNRGNKEINKF
jgi:hypothetical protein